eukprot:m.106835 g.106835  ORF g.106835 m.106835 type:complete len:422 (+) comp14238_c2_seq1:189-1454(+)
MAYQERAWLTPPAPADGPEAASAPDFSILSFNLLAQDLLRLHSHLYHECDTSSLSWEARRQMLREELLYFHADIICLQEAQMDHFTGFFLPFFAQEGYEAHFFPRVRRTDGCAVAFNTAVFQLLDANALVNVVYSCPEMEDFDVGNVGQIVFLRHLATGRVVCVGNTHIYFNPRRCDIKLLQIAMLFHRIQSESAARDLLGCPLLICGDFNLQPSSLIYNYIVHGSISYCALNRATASKRPRPSLMMHAEHTPFGHHFGNDQLPVWLASMVLQSQDSLEAPRCGLGAGTFGERRRRSSACHIHPFVFEDITAAINQTDVHTHESDHSRSSTPTSPAVNCHTLVHPFALTSTYLHIDRAGTKEMTTKFDWETVDFIFFSKKELVLRESLSLLTASRVRELGGMPGPAFPSDHQSLAARFSFA